MGDDQADEKYIRETIGYGSRIARSEPVPVEPGNPAEWARYWGHWKKMKVPGKSGGCVEIEVLYVLGRGRDLEGRVFDAFVRWYERGRNRDFHVLFVGEGERVEPAGLPVLCVPKGEVAGAWWVLPIGTTGGRKRTLPDQKKNRI